MAISHVDSPRSTRPLLAGLFVVALFGLTGITPPTARADAVDDTFLGALRSKGINIQTAQGAIIAAHEVCDELDLGRQKADVASEVMGNSNLDTYHAGFFVGASVKAYCPRHLG